MIKWFFEVIGMFMRYFWATVGEKIDFSHLKHTSFNFSATALVAGF